MTLNLKKINNYFIIALPIILLSGPLLLEIVFLIFTIINIKKLNYSNIIKFIKSEYFLTFFLVFFFFSTLLSNYSESYLKGLSYLRFIIYYFILYETITFEQKILVRFLIASTIAIIILIISNLLQSTIFTYMLNDGRTVMPFRPTEPITSNILFYLSAICMPIVFYKNKGKKKYIFFFFITFLLLANILSGDRMNTLQSTLLILIFVFFYFKIKDFIIFIFLATLICFTIINEFSIFSKTKITLVNRYSEFYTLIIKDKFTNNLWAKHYKAATNIWSNNKYFGSGIRSFRKECSAEKYKTSELFQETYSGCATHPHNIYLEILSENGIFCFIFFIFFLLSKIYSTIKKIQLNLRLKFKIKNIVLFSSISYLVVYSFPFKSFGSFYNNYQSFLFWFILFLIKKLTKKIYDK
jgi:O-antigen ligase